MKRYAPLVRKAPLKQRTPMRARRKSPRRVAVLRDEKYKSYVRTWPCEVCFVTYLASGEQGEYRTQCGRTEAAHTEPTNGMGSKGPDSGCAPLGLKHHRELHVLGLKRFERKYKIDLRKVAAELYARYLRSTEAERLRRQG